MQSKGGMRHVMIHYWCDYGTQTLDFSFAQMSLNSAFPHATFVYSGLNMQRGNLVEQGILLKQFKDAFPPGTIHICHLAMPSTEPPRYVIVKYRDSYFLGPANGFMPLGFEVDLEYFIIPNDGTYKWDELKALYIPAIKLLLEDPDKDLTHIFKPKLNNPKPLWIQPIVKNNFIRLSCLYVDPYGNCIFNINKAEFERYRAGRNVRIRTPQRIIERISNDYNDIQEGGVLALFGWGDIFQIAQNKGHSSNNLGIYVDSAIMVEFHE